MTTFHKIVALSLAGLLTAVSAEAAAQAECPVESVIEIETITRTADAVWKRRLGARRATLKKGWAAASESVPGRVQSLNISVAPELSLQDSETNEYIGSATLAIELGNVGEARRTALSAQWDAVDAQLDVERWTFVDAVQDTYLEWRKHELERGHLEDYLAEANAELEPIRKARDRQLISRIDLADLEAEVAWISAELADSRRRSKLARARFDALIGVRCELAVPDAIHDAPSRENPWKALVARVDEFPEIRAYNARKSALSAQADTHDAATPWMIEAGIGARSVGFEDHFLGPVLSLTIPFQTERASADIARAEAQAEATSGEWAAVRIRAELAAEASNFDVLVDEYFELDTGYIKPLDRRAALMDEAFKASQIEIDRVIRARRELHEAEHKLILHRAEIDSRRLKASAVRQLISQSGTAGVKP